MALETLNLETLMLHAGSHRRDLSTNSVAVPIYQTTSYEFDSTEHAGKLFALQELGNIYTRITNPTTQVLEERVTALEGGATAVAVSSGSSAVSLAIQNVASSGDNIVASPHLYGGTYNLFTNTLPKMGIEVRFADPSNPDSFAELSDDHTRAYFGETLPNPKLVPFPIAEVSDIGRKKGIPLIVDNTAAPITCRPFDHGAAVIVHSLTKFIGGHGNSLGGVVTESGKFDWGSGRFPSMTDPVASYNGLNFWENFGEYAFCTKLRSEQLRDIGAAMSPTNAFLLLQGIETLPFRMDAHVANAKLVVEFLDNHEVVSWVNYAGLESSPYFDLAQKYMPRGPGAVFTFGVRGGREAGARFIESLQLISHLANVGDARTLVIHPASTTHQQLSDENLVSGGVTPDMIRLSIGLEDIEDILWDLDQALHRVSL